MKVYVVPYDPAWATEFDRESPRVASALGDNVVEIHHIGSTAIPGIYAKPIIDLLVGVRNLDAVDARGSAMADLGYEGLGEFGIPGRRYFRKNDEHGLRSHQVHVFVRDSPDMDRHLAFRDYMRAHPDTAEEYSNLKRKVAARHPDDIFGYMEGKDAFIKEVEAKAIAWRQRME